MSNKSESKSVSDRSKIFQIKVKGHLDKNWSDTFDDLTITPERDGTTLISGKIVDDAALYGLLKRIRDSGMSLVSVNSIPPDQADLVDGE